MDVIRTHTNKKKIRLALVFFVFTMLWHCKKYNVFDVPMIKIENSKAVSVSFHSETILKDLAVYTQGNLKNQVLGEFSMEDGLYRFIPVVPFTAGQSYDIVHENSVILNFQIQSTNDKMIAPEVMAIYPSADTIPENWLKMYLFFSKPMQEVGKSLDYIRVTKNNDTEPIEVFLELESELWNAEHTRLTLWLDPGRIKTDLIPNKEKGLPIVNGNSYTIKIDRNWRSADGITLNDDVYKTYYASDRDMKKPNLGSWEIHTPVAGLKDELIIDFKEPLDAVLSKESIRVFDDKENRVAGDHELAKFESHLIFAPEFSWSKGIYKILVDTDLEDLAGNNLNHLFDVNTKSIKNNDDTTTKNYITFNVH